MSEQKTTAARLRKLNREAAEASATEEPDDRLLPPDPPPPSPPPTPEEIARREERRRKNALRKSRQHERDRLYGRRVSLDVDTRTHEALKSLSEMWNAPIKHVIKHLAEWADENRDRMPVPDFAGHRRPAAAGTAPDGGRLIRYVSFFAGIEAFTQAVRNLRWECKAVAQWDPDEKSQYAARVIMERLSPATRNLGDITRLEPERMGGFEVLVGGSPCQAFSLAGKRLGTADPRGRLTERYIDFACRAGVTASRAGIGGVPVLVWENVVGVLSQRYDTEPETPNGAKRAGDDAAYDDNKDLFGSVLSALTGFHGQTCVRRPRGKDGKIMTWPAAGMVEGPSRIVAWRILTASDFGLPQIRKRLFLIAARRGDGIDPLRILFQTRPRLGRSHPAPEGHRWWSINNGAADFTFRNPPPVKSLKEILEASNDSVQDRDYLLGRTEITHHLKNTNRKNNGKSQNQTAWVVSCLEYARDNQSVFSIDDLRNYLADSKRKTLSPDAIINAIPPDAATLIDANDKAGRFSVRGGDEAACTITARYGKAPSQRPFIVRRAGDLIWLRRMKIVEGERLMGFPDDYTRVGRMTPSPGPDDHKADNLLKSRHQAHIPGQIAKYRIKSYDLSKIEGLRFKVLGNSMAVPVVGWLAEQIDGEIRHAIERGTFSRDENGVIPFIDQNDPELLWSQTATMALFFGGAHRARINLLRLDRLLKYKAAKQEEN